MIIRSAESWLKSDLDLYYLDAEKVPLQFGRPDMQMILKRISDFYFIDPEYFKLVSENNLFKVSGNESLIWEHFSRYPYIQNFPALVKYKDRFRYVFVDSHEERVSIALGKFHNGDFISCLTHFNTSTDEKLFDKIRKYNKNEK
jgi:hypothetical protein